MLLSRTKTPNIGMNSRMDIAYVLAVFGARRRVVRKGGWRGGAGAGE